MDESDWAFKVIREIKFDNKYDYIEAGKLIENLDYDILLIQHEWTTYGGRYGSHLAFIFKNIFNIDIYLTIHTILDRDILRAQILSKSLITINYGF